MVVAYSFPSLLTTRIQCLFIKNYMNFLIKCGINQNCCSKFIPVESLALLYIIFFFWQ